MSQQNTPEINGYRGQSTWGYNYAIFLPKNPYYKKRSRKSVLQTPKIKGPQYNTYTYRFHTHVKEDGKVYFDYDQEPVDSNNSLYAILTNAAEHPDGPFDFYPKELEIFRTAGMLDDDGTIRLKIPNCLVELLPNGYNNAPGYISDETVENLTPEEVFKFSGDIMTEINRQERLNNPNTSGFKALQVSSEDDNTDKLKEFIKKQKHVIGAGGFKNPNNILFLQYPKPQNGNVDVIIALKGESDTYFIINIRRKVAKRTAESLETMSRRTLQLLSSGKLTTSVNAKGALLNWLEKEGFIDMLQADGKPPEDLEEVFE